MAATRWAPRHRGILSFIKKANSLAVGESVIFLSNTIEKVAYHRIQRSDEGSVALAHGVCALFR
jgi:hypothetical protein